MNAATISTTTNEAAPTAEAVRPLIPSKRPRPVVNRIRNERELAWTPGAHPLYSVIDGANVRAGESFAVVRPGWERWPLGIVSDHYRVVDHNVTRRQILEGAGDRVTRVTLGAAVQAGHGYHVAHAYEIRHMEAASVDGAPVKSRLIVAHDHTGAGALRAAMVVYVGPDPMGAVVRARAMHVATQPAMWAAEIDSMIEKSILVQDALLDLLRAAKARELTDTDREWIASKGIVSKKGKSAATLFDAMQSWFAGNVSASKMMTWGVWERRLDDEAIRVMCELLGLARYGTPIDDALGGGRRFGRGQRTAA